MKVRTMVGAVLAASVALQPVAGAEPANASPSDLRLPEISLWHDLALVNRTAQVTVVSHDVAGNIWYFDADDDDLVRVDLHSHAQTVFDIGTRLQVFAIVGAADGSIWYSEFYNNSINHLDPSTGAVEEFPLSGTSSATAPMVLGSDDRIWFGDPNLPRIVSVDKAGVVNVIPEPRGQRIVGMVAAEDGRIWYTRTGVDGMGTYDPMTGVFTDVGVPRVPGSSIAIGKSGHIWNGGLYGFRETALDGTTTDHRVIPAPGATPIYPMAMVGGDLAGDDSDELFFLDRTYGFGHAGEDGSIDFGRLDGERSTMDMDGEGHVWVNDLGSATLNWM